MARWRDAVANNVVVRQNRKAAHGNQFTHRREQNRAFEDAELREHEQVLVATANEHVLVVDFEAKHNGAGRGSLRRMFADVCRAQCTQKHVARANASRISCPNRQTPRTVHREVFANTAVAPVEHVNAPAAFVHADG